MFFTRENLNPIIIPGDSYYRQVAAFNPGVIFENNKYYLYERVASSLRPFICSIGLQISEDGVNFKRYGNKPIFSASDLGYPQGTIEDPRITKLDNKYYMTFACRPYTFNCNPTGMGVPDYAPLTGSINDQINNTLSGIAVSEDLINFRFVGFVNDQDEHDERDVVLLPVKVNGKYAILRRPKDNRSDTYDSMNPSIWISYSDDLKIWSKPKIVAKSLYQWEGGKIGAGPTPIAINEGLILLYHGVDEHSVYRIGAMLLDKSNPEKVLYRTENYIMEPQMYYEKVGLVIPNVIFPTGNVLKDNVFEIFYGCCDTCIGKASIKLDKLLRLIKNEK